VDLLRSAEIACKVDLPDVTPDLPVSADVRHQLVLTVKEALTNVVRHARATEVRLHIAASPEQLTIVISDNGCGLKTPVESAEADGLRNMQQRMQELGGLFAIETAAAGGTRVELGLSLPAKRAPADSSIA
jgi:signal transduction histidine kinase